MKYYFQTFKKEIDKLDEGWKNFFLEDKILNKLQEIARELDQIPHTIYPKQEEIFNAFKSCPLDKTKTLILGQDPYHGENQANGLAFAVKNSVKTPPSLRNIKKELNADLNKTLENNDLKLWAHQGVLLLNTVLTVEEGNADSHKGIGWEMITDEVIKKLSQEQSPIVFILWGGKAQKKEKLIDKKKHFIIKSAHPSPLSVYRGFWESKPFSKQMIF